MAARWRAGAALRLPREIEEAAPPSPELREELLDPAVLERYLLLLSLEVESQRMLEEYRQELAKIDVDRAAANARVKTPAV